MNQKHFDPAGSPAWLARRAGCFNAADAPAMMACSANKTRTELLAELSTGVPREFSDYVQERVLDKGHAVEDACRQLAEEIVGEEMAIYACTLPVAGLSRPIGASFDGATFMDDKIWECKSLNDALREALPNEGRDSHTLNDASKLPKAYRVQCEQQLMASETGEKTLFTAASIDRNGVVTEERHAWYYPDLALRADIIAGWGQFDRDLAAYVPAPVAAIVVAAPMQALPSVMVQVTGDIVIHENFDAFETAARDFLAHRLIREPRTDQDFADLDVQIKAMKGAEAALDAAEGGWIAQIEPVSIAKRRKDMLSKLMRDNRLMAEKLLESEKARRRVDIVSDGVKALAAHIAALNGRIGKAYMPVIPADFGGVIKGKRSLASMEDAVSSELARAKIAANAVADTIDANLKHLAAEAADYGSLFHDIATICLKATDDFAALVQYRVADHKAKEQKRADDLAEQSRERIRKEEAERLAIAQREAQEAEDVLIASLWGNARRIEQDRAAYIRKAIGTFESAAPDWENDPRPRVAAAVAGARAEMKAKLDAALLREQAAAEPVAVSVIAATHIAAPAPAVIAMPRRIEPAASTHPTLSLGAIKERIAPLSITAEGMATMGFVGLKERGSCLYHESDFPHICAAMVQHLEAIDAKQAA